MDLLYANDRPGRYPQSWYAASVDLPEPRAALDGELRADVCVVGGGYTGLSAALHLAEAGLSVVAGWSGGSARRRGSSSCAARTSR